jgi:predicted membrane channel-forming protein YqfA (hemolysin III family)
MVIPAIDETGIDVDLAKSNLNRAVTLIGSNLAIFTFVLIFLYPRYSTGSLNGDLFQAALSSSLLAIFLFGFSGISYFEAVAIAKNSAARRKALIRRGDFLFVLSLIVGTAMPALVLFTLGLLNVAIFATVLWIGYVSFLLRQGLQLRKLMS